MSGMIVNPEVNGFRALTQEATYVDKSDWVSWFNRRLGTTHNRWCVTRPRCFGKTSTVQMLAAAYSRGAAMKATFLSLKAGRDAADRVLLLRHLNQHDVIV